MCIRVIEDSKKIYNSEIKARKVKGNNHSVGILKEYGKDILRVCFGYTNGFSCIMNGALRLAFMVVIMLVMGITNIWGQVTDGVYYITNTDNPDNLPNPNPNGYDRWYLWPSVTTNATTGQQYLTTYYDAQAAACNESGVSYEAYDNSYSHWVVKYLTDGTGRFQLINPKLNKYIVIRSKATYGDRDVWLDDEPTGNEIVRSFFKLNGAGPYLISPAINATDNIANATEYTVGTYTLNSAKGNKRYICSTDDKQTPKNLDQRQGLLQFYNDAPSWTFTQDLLAAPTISNVSAYNTITITDANSLPAGYTIRYTTGDGSQAAPTATTGSAYSSPIDVDESMTIMAVVVRYGVVLTEVASKAVVPIIIAPTVTNNFDGTISLSTTTPNSKIFYTTNGTTPSNSNGTLYDNTPFSLGNATTIKAITYNSDLSESSEVITYNLPQYAAPAISFNNFTSQVTINPGSGANAYYNTGDGTQADPTTSSTGYSEPFYVTSSTTVKAIATHAGYLTSSVATLAITQVATPTIQDNGSNAISITTATGSATIFYTTDGSTPTTSSTQYNGPLTENVSNVTIKAIAVKENMITSSVGSGTVKLQCSTPVITRDGMTFSISCSMPTDVSLYYSLDGSTPATLYNGPVSFTSDQLPMTVTAVAKHVNYTDSESATFTLINGHGTSSDPYLIYGATDFANFISNVNAGTTSSACYKLEADISASTASVIETPFTGTFDGGSHTISNLNHALFNSINGGTVKNVRFSSVDITTGTYVGAICGEADGVTKIYNCGVLSGSVSGTYVGGLVGHIKSGSSVRVVNCYNYANVSGDTYAAGIVGYNEGTVGDVRIALCMMYGTVNGNTNISPVYAGNHRSNVQDYTEYNYYLYSTEKDNAGQRIIRIPYTDYNDQLAIDKEEYLTRFPFYRHILNTHRELASYFLFGDYLEEHVDEIGHWVVKKEDNAPKYPIIEPWVKNRTSTPTQANNNLPNTTADYAGKLLTFMGTNGYLSVSIKIGDNSYSASLPITDMDTLRYDYNYGKVILPFANEYEINTDYSQICTGWKITKVGSSTSSSVTNYNFADRNNLQKDIYNEDTNPFIYAQGGYYIVPTGVTSIEITANFATAYYLSDATYEIGYASDYTGRTGLGGNVPSFHDQTVYNSLKTAVNALATTTTNPHKQAIVLVGNYHYDLAKGDLSTAKGFTLMSIDADNNQEPDYGFYSIAPDRPQTPALRFDFVPIISLGMAAKVNGSNYYPGVPIWKPRGWYEQTETTISIMNQFELDSSNFTKDETNNENKGKGQNPCILNGGYFVQIIRSNNGNCSKVSYFKIGGNAYVKEFYPGSHSNQTRTTTIVPVNVTGGQVDECFMTGYKSGAKAIGSDIHFWCSGGKIGKFLGAYMDKPQQTSDNVGTVNMTAQVDHALINRFFGGGTSQNAAISGDITITINNSKVNFYCGGPEFGNMSEGKTVITTANNTSFGEYYGAGFGGTSITYSPQDGTPNIGRSVPFPSSFYTYNSNTDGKKRLSRSGSLGLATCYKFEFLMHSSNKTQIVARFITGYADFNLATTGNVTNNLTGCTIVKDFYGAGCQGKVNGTVNSTLTNCTIEGSAFGGGYKATSNEVRVYPATPPTLSVYNGETGIFSEFGTTEPVTFNWVQGNGDYPTANDANNKLSTSKNVTMTDLGNVTGAISLTIDGGQIGTQGDVDENHGNVFGGGNESKSLNNASVTLKGDATIFGNVFGGGNKAIVSGSTQVNIED